MREKACVKEAHRVESDEGGQGHVQVELQGETNPEVEVEEARQTAATGGAA